jgi:hypothetical protein
MVDLSDNEPLMDWFPALPAPRMLMYGEQNNALSYLGPPQDNAWTSPRSPKADFPMYANPPEMWRRMDEFVRAAETRR